MPATATQKNAFFQCRCTNGEKLCWNFLPGACVSVSLGFMFCGTPTRPLRSALPAAALCSGSRRRFSVPVPMVLFFTNAEEVPFLTKVVDVPFFTNLLALPAGLTTRGCTVREGARWTFRTATARFL